MHTLIDSRTPIGPKDKRRRHDNQRPERSFFCKNMIENNAKVEGSLQLTNPNGKKMHKLHKEHARKPFNTYINRLPHPQRTKRQETETRQPKIRKTKI